MGLHLLGTLGFVLPGFCTLLCPNCDVLSNKGDLLDEVDSLVLSDNPLCLDGLGNKLDSSDEVDSSGVEYKGELPGNTGGLYEVDSPSCHNCPHRCGEGKFNVLHVLLDPMCLSGPLETHLHCHH